MRYATLLATLAVLHAADALPAQATDTFDERTPAEKLLGKARRVAFVGVDVYDGKGGPLLRKVTVLVADGKFRDIGADLDVPPSYERVEGGVLVPGLVSLGHATSSSSRSTRRPTRRPHPIPIPRGRRRPPTRTSSRSATFTPTAKAVARVDPRRQEWAELLKAGVTTIGVNPAGSGLSGLAGAIRPAGREAKDMVLADASFLWLGMSSDSAHKKMLRDGFEAAAKLLEARKKAKAAKKAAPASAKKTPPKGAKPAAVKDRAAKKPDAKKPAKKPGQKPATKPAQKPAKPKEDPRHALLAKVLEGKLGVVARVGGLRDVLHLFDALEGHEVVPVLYHKFRSQSTQTLDRLTPLLVKRKVKVILPLEFGFAKDTRWFSNPLSLLTQAGVPVLLDPGTQASELASLWYRLGRMARTGVAKAKLVAGLTGEPAKLLGVEKKLGTIAKGLAANCIHFDRDPFGPAAKPGQVWFEGRPVERTPRLHEAGGAGDARRNER